MGDDALFGAGETKGNFYGELENSDYNILAPTKKGKKVGKKGKGKGKNISKL
jgi:hypothetical protein